MRATVSGQAACRPERPVNPTATAAPADTTRNRLILAKMLDAAPGRPPLTVVTGPAGAGRSTLLDQLGSALAEAGIRPLVLRISPNPVPTPLYSALRSISGPARDGAEAPATWWSPVDPMTGTHAATTPKNTAAAIAEPLVAAGNVAVLIDDAQWTDPHSLAVIEQLAGLLAGTTVRCVCAVRVPVPPAMYAAGCAALDRLRHNHLVDNIHLRPLGAADMSALAAAEFKAKPDAELVAHLRRLTGGLPAALVPVLEEYRRGESIRIVDGYAHLAPRHRQAVLPANHGLLLNVRRTGSLPWSVAKAAAVLYPLGEAAPKLIGEAVGVAETGIHEALEKLCEAGVLRRGAGGQRWRFRVPLLATALSAQLGPYERRHLAQRAITALWHGDASCDDPGYRADQLAIAGKLVDPERARTDLVHSAVRAGADGYDDRWLRSAAALPAGQPDRARTLLTQATVSLEHGDYRQALASADTVRHELAGQLADDQFSELNRVCVLASHALGDTESLELLAADDDSGQVIARATALLLLGRWRECGALLATSRSTWEADPVSACSGLVLDGQVHFAAGSHLLALRSIDEACRVLPEDAHRRRRDVIGCASLIRLVTTGFEGPQPVPAHNELPPVSRAIIAAAEGRFDQAMELARRAIASGTVRGHDLSHTFLHQAAATIQLARGRLTGGRELLAVARETNPPLPYLLDGAEALIDRALGQPVQARKRLQAGLGYAGERGLVVETDRLLLHLAELEAEREDLAAARRQVREIERVATVSGTAGTALNLALARAIVERDTAAATDAIALAREYRRPYDLATVLTKLVQHGAGDPALLPEAYDLLGELGALLDRARLRNLMQEHGVPVPGRRQTVAENEQLLSVLVADGLTNKQIATVLGTSEKSVESRLARLFSRTGLRSRVELAMSVLTGVGG
ncbi:helix-turn-helix transcriptional regulator [Amycolatopsis pithecellobii]|uniref:AAA family ATPase n=1 Tax=Amycolatopsis pithecellobii TaxID=664692 RepID=A0A6N7Z7E3_9PSEU|nr:AAA family ATPase [Amycolatopsis pithecellobii]MTD55836.1 AAA family ATPase [Amycolatopsis pithecellobii]